MAFVLEVLDLNSQAIEASLDGTSFYIVLDWNQFGQYWTMAIRNAGYQMLLDGISLVPNYSLTYQFRYEEMPAGDLVVGTPQFTNGPIPRDGFSSGKYHLIYYTQQDLLNAGALENFGRTSIAI